MGCVPSGPLFCRDASLRLLSTILRLVDTCAAVDALDEVPIAMVAVLVEVSPPRTCSRCVTVFAVQCFSLASTSRHA